MTLIQRFGSALYLNIHFYMLFLDGVYVGGVNGSVTHVRCVKTPTRDELTQLTHIMALRIGHFLERQQVMERDIENSCPASDSADEDPMHTLLGHSITYASP